MDTLSRSDLDALFEQLRDTYARNRSYLIELDGKVGDSDLGITMTKGFAAACDSVRANAAEPIGKTIQLAGMAMAKAAPSTMGTLMATGLMRGGKALADCPHIGTAEMAAFWAAFHQGVVERGKARPGEKTLVDVLGPVQASLDTAARAGLPLRQALEHATEAAAAGLESTKDMVARHGKAACFQDKSLGLQDAGATAGFLMVETMRAFVAREQANI